MKSLNRVLLLALLLVCGPAFAEEAEGIKFGPWRLGMSKEEVVALADAGPYEDVAATGALTTKDAKVVGQKVKATLVFGDAGLRSIEAKVYEGKDWGKAARTVLEIYDKFASAYGGANVTDITDKVSRKELDSTILDRTLGTAESMNKQYAARGRVMTATYDMVPLRQPDGSKLHCQWGYIGKSDTYFVYIYQDGPDAPSRALEDNIVTEKL